MKKVLFTAAALLTLATLSPSQGTPLPARAEAADTYAEGLSGGDIRITLFGQPFPTESPPFLSDGAALVPLRNIAEALGTEVSWDETTRSVSLSKGASTIKLFLDSREAVKNGQPLQLAAAPRLIGGTTMVPLRFIGEAFDTLVTWDADTRTAAIDHLQSLPTVGSFDKMKAMLEQSGKLNGQLGFDASAAVAREGVAPVPSAEKSAASSKGATESPRAPVSSTMKQKTEASVTDHSTTNAQVEGVDESDVIKTDGTYLYQVNQGRIFITQAVPADRMEIKSVIHFDDSPFRPQELYVDDRYLIVIGATSRNTKEFDAIPASSAKRMIAPIPAAPSTVKAIIYDIADKTAPKQLREVELDGDYVSSRKIGPALYLVTNKYNGYPYSTKVGSGAGTTEEAKAYAPVYADSAVPGGSIAIDYPEIRYFPQSPESNYMLVGGINLDRPDQPAHVTAYLGSGQNVYASGDNLYVAVGKMKQLDKPSVNTGAPATPGADALMKSKIAPPSYETNTAVYKFRLEQGKTTFVTQGEVPGTVLNQYSMDEHNGIFRIATTNGEMWRTDENTSKNNVYTLDEALKPLGKLEGIAPGERIYSVRFMGNRAYMVTFKNTDPLFAIDLANPAAPTVLGALKIPGYSDYLHPYDDTHLIGFGKDTVEMPLKGDPNDPNRTVAYYQGMKLSLFDVTDVSSPVELFKETIGDRGTESELLHNPKALLFSKERGLLAFPVTVMEVPNKAANNQDAITAYGQFKFQGAYVYDLDLTNGFRLKTPITHMTADDRLKSGNVPYNSVRNVERIVYIGDTLYTLSKGLVKANDIATLQEKGSLTIPNR
ncbi:beta-propeller domain-containing protein [Paenibacillus hodogayensis]|uniref:Beta-propeller domain-containing protein n=1 Tax=Paenibacillus hodogayensis TaxID=279208 RepID=A0ABV5W160_9BACL